MMFLRRRKSSAKILTSGIWSVKTAGGYLTRDVPESRAWRVFLETIEDAELLKGNVVMSARTSLSPTIGGIDGL
jgi:hypothetical protein